MSFCQIWSRSPEEFWINSQPIQGFPCIGALLFKKVSLGDEGDEDQSKLLENLLFIYPSEVTPQYRESLMAAVQTFMTFSTVSLNSKLCTLSWSNSHISVSSIQMEDKNLLVFFLKMPNSIPIKAVSYLLENTIRFLQFLDPFFRNPTSNPKKISAQLQGFRKLIVLSIFSSSSLPPDNDMFKYLIRNYSIFPSKSILPLATELGLLIKRISPSIIGTTFIIGEALVFTEISPPLLNFFPYLCDNEMESIAGMTYNFHLFSLCLSKNDFSEEKDYAFSKYFVAFRKIDKLTMFILMSESGDINNHLKEVDQILSNGTSSFISDCLVYGSVIETIDPGQLWYCPQINASRKNPTDSSVASIKFSQIHFDLQESKEISFCNGTSLISGASFHTFEAFQEVKCEIQGRVPFVDLLSRYFV